MFSSSIRSALFALVVSAIAASAAPGLSLKVSGADSVTGVDALKVKTTITNTGDVTLKLLKDPRGALSPAEGDTFAITNSEGATAAFTGKRFKYVPSAVVSKNSEKSFTVLAPGEAVEVDHDLSTSYNLTATGEGVYSIEAQNKFYYVTEKNVAEAIYANVEALHTKVQGKLAVARRSTDNGLSKRASYVGCTSSEQSLLVTAAANAQTYQANSLSYLNAHTASTTRYTTWFGTYTAARHTTLVSHYSKMASAGAFSTYTYDCSTCDEGTHAYAYVYPSEFGRVYLCSVYWQAPATGTDSKAGTLIHESSHFTAVGSTDDHVYGQSAAKSLAISSPANAVDNADNHEYFAENTPAQS